MMVVVLVAAGALGACGVTGSVGQTDRPVVVGCERSVYGTLSAGWRSRRQGTVVAGRIAWVAGDTTAHFPGRDYGPHRGLAPFVKALAVVEPGFGVTVRIPRRERGRLSLDYANLEPRGEIAGRSAFRVSDGATAITFKPCSRAAAPGGTQFAGGFIVSGARCAEVDVVPVRSRALIRRYIPFGVSARGCGPRRPH